MQSIASLRTVTDANHGSAVLNSIICAVLDLHQAQGLTQMLNIMAGNVALAALGFGLEKGWNAFKAARAERVHRYAPQSFNGPVEPAVAILTAYRVTVAERHASGAVGAVSHDIYAVDCNDAHAWALRHYSHLDSSNLRIITEAVH